MIARTNEGKRTVAIVTGWSHLSTEEFEANKVFICQAVNQHDQLIAQRNALLEVCKIADIFFKECVFVWGSDDQSRVDTHVKELRSAIALCEPKEKEASV